MGMLGKYERHINIVAKFFIIIILLFICYRVVIYDAQINELRRTVASIETSLAGGDDGMPQYLGMAQPAANVIAPRDSASTYITVNITGAVNAPGVYTLVEGQRLVNLIELAGGEHENADIERVNQAAHLQDASHIRIPFIGEHEDFVLANVVVDGGAASAGASGSGSGLVNINTATRAEFETLPGIGPVIAGNIVDFRELNGPFNHIDDLLSVNRVGDVLLGGIRHLIEL